MTSPLYTGMIGGSPLGLTVIGSGKLTTNIVVGIAVAVSITGVGAVGGVGSLSPSASSNITITGVAAAGGIGSLHTQVAHTLTGVDAADSAGVFSTQLSRHLTLPATTVSVHEGALDPTKEFTLPGVHAPTAAGQPQVFIYGDGYFMANLNVVVQPADNISNDVSLRYSDTKGASWGTPVMQPLGEQGEFLTSLQWRRLGMARDRIFEISWTTPFETSIVGAFVDFEVAQS